jgi:hypothetical protein
VQAGRRVSDRSLANQFGISIDFGAEISGSENAFALQLLPLLDLAGLLTPEQVASAAVESAARVGREASETENLRFKTIALGRELDARNHEVARLHRDLHERNLSIQTTETSLHEKNLEIERLHRDLHNRNVQLGSTESRLNDVLSSRSWRWTAPLRALFRKSSRSH